uniref:Transmembrane protein n=2 Tax=Clytia hemisphaerica TaxID=252671 RepID=A0A7M5WSU3_9CNID
MTITSENPTTTLTGFNEIWYKIFLYCLGSNVFVHVIAAFIALRALHKNKYGRYLPVAIILIGFLYPISGGFITSCCIAWIYTAANYAMEVQMCAIYGVGQTFFLVVVSFVRLYGTL